MAKPIFLAGDSWGVGTFNPNVAPPNDPLRTKIEYFFKDRCLINKSVQGSSNYVSIKSIEENIENDYIFVWIQTDPFRDISGVNTYNKIITYSELSKYCIDLLYQIDDIKKKFYELLNKSYYDLDTLAAKHHKKIYCIGGCQEIPLGEIEKYNNLIPVIPSIVKFLHPQVNDFFYYCDDIIRFVKKHRTDNLNFNNSIHWLSTEWIKTCDFFMSLQKKGQEGLFWPEAFHPNEVGVKIWTDYLKSSLD